MVMESISSANDIDSHKGEMVWVRELCNEEKGGARNIQRLQSLVQTCFSSLHTGSMQQRSTSFKLRTLNATKHTQKKQSSWNLHHTHARLLQPICLTTTVDMVLSVQQLRTSSELDELRGN